MSNGKSVIVHLINSWIDKKDLKLNEILLYKNKSILS